MSLRKVTSICVTSSWKTLFYKKHTKIHDLSEHKIPAACVCQGQITLSLVLMTGYSDVVILPLVLMTGDSGVVFLVMSS